MTSILLRGGNVLQHDQNDHVVVRENIDVLIEGSEIVRIAKMIDPCPDSEVIDCTGKLISPGFIDTHHHVWQTQLKGRHADELLIEYMYSGYGGAKDFEFPDVLPTDDPFLSAFNSSAFSAKDIFWGQLGGCLEMLNAGTTTVVDHAHMNHSPEHNHNAVSATVASGIRSVFCYSPNPRVSSWNPLKLDSNVVEDFIIDTFEELATAAPFGEGRVTLGFAFDAWFLPREIILPLFERVKKHGIRTITVHSVRNATMGTDSSSLAELIDSYGLLDRRFLFSHSTNMTVKEVDLCHSRGYSISSTPDSELQMAHGFPVCFDDDLGVQSQCSLGVDCHSNNSGDLVSQMRLGLQAARGRSNERFYAKGKEPRRVYKKVEEAFNLGTIQGARAIGMQDKIGSIAEGKTADLIVFDTDSVAMVCAAQHDPVAAIVLHSSPADINTVIVDGKIRKREGRLLPIELDERGEIIAGKEVLEWKEVARHLIQSRDVIQKEIEKHDVEDARKNTLQIFHIDESKIVDEV